MGQKFWLLKTEPSVFSIDDLAQKGVAHWEGVRNYQARNYLRDEMKPGDGVLIYHSNANPPGVVGLAKVSKGGHPDHFAFDKDSRFFDPKSKPENPTWYMVDVQFVKKFGRMISLDELKLMPQLEGMLVTKKGMRLSVQPVENKHYRFLAGREWV